MVKNAAILFFKENIGDRFGFHHVMMSVALWPTILVMVGDVWRSKRPVTRDVEDRLYSKLAYLVTKVTFSINFNALDSYFTFFKVEN